MHKADKYTYRVTWSEEDGEYLATVAEFPSLSWLDENRNKAIKGVVELVKEVMEDLTDSGEAVPMPFSERNFSGKFQLRIPPEKHRELAIEAAEQGISLNRLIASRI